MISDSGSVACIDGYEWLNPEASDDYRCQEKTYLPVLAMENTLDSVQLTVVGTGATGLTPAT